MTRRDWNIKLDEMIDASVHLGHNTKKWNPKMGPYLAPKCTTRKGIHLTNLVATARFLSEACDVVFDIAAKNVLTEEEKKEEKDEQSQFLIVGTKKRVADSVFRAAIRAQCHYVNKKWRSGMLTNWATTETRLKKFRDLRIEEKGGGLKRLPKRDVAILKRQLSHLQRSLDGIQYMKKLPACVIIIDQQKDYTALRECIKLGIPTISLIDTNSDPDLANLSIPANDDSRSSIKFILNKLVFAIREGRSEFMIQKKKKELEGRSEFMIQKKKKKELSDFPNLHNEPS